jgi:hypothetical protein
VSISLDCGPHPSPTVKPLTERELLRLVADASEQVAVALQRRDELIREAKALGAPVPKIAEAAGVVRSRIYQILGEYT